MWHDLPIQVTVEHLSRAQGTPVGKALAELIWNGVDADADEVTVEFAYGELQAITQIVVADDGHGLPYGEVEEKFGKLGSPHKRLALYSRGRRPLHGRLGEGRFKAFALGSKVEWQSVFETPSGRTEYTIVGRTEALDRFTISDVQPSNSRSGMVVKVSEVSDRAARLDPEALVAELTASMAPYLMANPKVTVKVAGECINPQSVIKDSGSVDLSVDASPEWKDARLRVVEWVTGAHRDLFLCAAEGIAVDQDQAGPYAGVSSFSAYLLSNYINEMAIEGRLVMRAMDEGYLKLREKVDTALAEYFRARLAQDSQETIRQLKAERVYPFQGEPRGRVERAERQVFDICAVRVHSYLPDFSRSPSDQKKLILRLLRQTLETNPSTLTRILREVLRLRETELQDFAELLDKTTLPAVISTAKMIAERVEFLNGLEQIVYGRGVSKLVKERSLSLPTLFGRPLLT